MTASHGKLASSAATRAAVETAAEICQRLQVLATLCVADQRGCQTDDVGVHLTRALQLRQSVSKAHGLQTPSSQKSRAPVHLATKTHSRHTAARGSQRNLPVSAHRSLCGETLTESCETRAVARSPEAAMSSSLSVKCLELCAGKLHLDADTLQ